MAHGPAAEANAPTDEAGRQYHIRLTAGDVPGYVLLPGDPGRVERIGHDWEEYQELAFYREYKSARGTYQGVPIAAVSTGIGMGSAEIGLQELRVIGTHTVIKVGTTGALAPSISCGDLIVPTAGMRRDGVSGLYAPPEFPAFAHPEVFLALIEACQRLGYRYHVGLVCSSGSFYLGQGRPVAGGYTQSSADAETLIGDLQALRVTNFDMESAGVMVLSHCLGIRAGSVVSVMANRTTNEWGDNGGERRACHVGSEAVRILTEWDAVKRRAGVPTYFPSLFQTGPVGS